MTIEQLSKPLRTPPFRPFVILTADRREYRVSHPDLLVMLPEAQRTFLIRQGDENYTILDLLHVCGLQFGPQIEERKNEHGEAQDG